MRAIAKAIIQRAVAADDPLVAALTAAENAMSAAFELWEQDQAAYREAYTAAIRQALTDRGLMVEVEVVEACGEWEWGPLIDELHEYARKNAPLPMTGAAPDWANGTPADALHRRTARVRAQERAAAHDRGRPRLGQRHPRRCAAPRRPDLPRASSSSGAMNHSPAE